MLNKERGIVNPHTLIGPGKLRLGTKIIEHGVLDPRSEQNILAIRMLLEEGGIAFINDHIDFSGMIVAGALLAEYLQINRLTGPATLKVTETPISGPWLARINKMDGVEVEPVPRGEEMKRAKKKEFKIIKSLVKFFEKNGDSQVEAIRKALEVSRFAPVLYGRTMGELYGMIGSYKSRRLNLKNEPFKTTMIALFGSRKKYGMEEAVRSGLIELLQTGVWVVPTYSRRIKHRKTLFRQYVIEVGEPMRFEPGTDAKVIAAVLTERYRRFDETA